MKRDMKDVPSHIEEIKYIILKNLFELIDSKVTDAMYDDESTNNNIKNTSFFNILKKS
jgi:hypothetical protein